MPSLNLTPSITWGKRLLPASRRHVLLAAVTSLKTIADGKFGTRGEAASPQISQQFPPVLRALAKTGLKADQFLPALRCRANDHQDALLFVFQAALDTR